MDLLPCRTPKFDTGFSGFVLFVLSSYMFFSSMSYDFHINMMFVSSFFPFVCSGSFLFMLFVYVAYVILELVTSAVFSGQSSAVDAKATQTRIRFS